MRWPRRSQCKVTGVNLEPEISASCRQVVRLTAFACLHITWLLRYLSFREPLRLYRFRRHRRRLPESPASCLFTCISAIRSLRRKRIMHMAIAPAHPRTTPAMQPTRNTPTPPSPLGLASSTITYAHGSGQIRAPMTPLTYAISRRSADRQYRRRTTAGIIRPAANNQRIGLNNRSALINHWELLLPNPPCHATYFFFCLTPSPDLFLWS